MKKVLVAIVAVFYLGTSVGATVNLHYCMGELVNWDFSHKTSTADKQCGKCGMEKAATKKGCCEDKYQVLQVEKDQKAESAFQLMQPAVTILSTTFPAFSVPVIASVSEEYPVAKAPPRTPVPVYIRYRVFRI